MLIVSSLGAYRSIRRPMEMAWFQWVNYFSYAFASPQHLDGLYARLLIVPLLFLYFLHTIYDFARDDMEHIFQMYYAPKNRNYCMNIYSQFFILRCRLAVLDQDKFLLGAGCCDVA
jgi:hypothetical protein